MKHVPQKVHVSDLTRVMCEVLTLYGWSSPDMGTGVGGSDGALAGQWGGVIESTGRVGWPDPNLGMFNVPVGQEISCSIPLFLNDC